MISARIIATTLRNSHWARCPIGRKRPHKRDLFALYDAYRRGESPDAATLTKASDEALDEQDFQVIEREDSST